MIKLSPQEKKQYSLEKDCRNCYGENDKASRKAIQRRKRWVNRSYRRTVQQQLHGEVEQIQDQVLTVNRKVWKKIADQPLGERLHLHYQREIESLLWKIYQQNQNLYEQLIGFLQQQHLTQAHQNVLARRALDCMLNRNIFGLALDEVDVFILNTFLDVYQQKSE